MHNRRLIVALLFVFDGTRALAHEGHEHAKPESIEPRIEEQEKRLVEITADYQMIVAPLFQKACADCHSGDTQYPWYAMIPGIKQWIKGDIEEARKHIEFSNGYPFQSHGTPIEDLIAVEKVIKEDTMPPLRYRLMHGKARLDENEKRRIIDWARRGQELLRADLPRTAQP